MDATWESPGWISRIQRGALLPWRWMGGQVQSATAACWPKQPPPLFALVRSNAAAAVRSTKYISRALCKARNLCNPQPCSFTLRRHLLEPSSGWAGEPGWHPSQSCRHQSLAARDAVTGHLRPVCRCLHGVLLPNWCDKTSCFQAVQLPTRRTSSRAGLKSSTMRVYRVQMPSITLPLASRHCRLAPRHLSFSRETREGLVCRPISRTSYSHPAVTGIARQGVARSRAVCHTLSRVQELPREHMPVPVM